MKKLIWLLLFFYFLSGYSQNLVLNPSFEDTLNIYSNIVKWNDTVPYIIDPYIQLMTKYWKDSRYITEYYNPIFTMYYYYVYPNANQIPIIGSPTNFLQIIELLGLEMLILDLPICYFGREISLLIFSNLVVVKKLLQET